MSYNGNAVSFTVVGIACGSSSSSVNILQVVPLDKLEFQLKIWISRTICFPLTKINHKIVFGQKVTT